MQDKDLPWWTKRLLKFNPDKRCIHCGVPKKKHSCHDNSCLTGPAGTPGKTKFALTLESAKSNVI